MRTTDMGRIPPNGPGAAVLGAFGQMGLTQTAYAEHAGKSKQAVGQNLAKDMHVSTLVDMLEFAGYKLVAVPERMDLPGSCFEIGENDG